MTVFPGLDACFFSVRDISYTPTLSQVTITVVTDSPVHLFMRWSFNPPDYHSIPTLRRGIALHGNRYICFTAYHDNEQEEAGNTLTHTFIKPAWWICQTRYFYFWGMNGSLICRSTSPVFSYHNVLKVLEDASATFENRHIFSRHGTWTIAREGANLNCQAIYQSPNSLLYALTELITQYHIVRAYLSFETSHLPPCEPIPAAEVGLYITDKEGLTGSLCLTRGQWTGTVDPEDYTAQTLETTVLGSISLGAIVLNEYNWIALNGDGLSWLNRNPPEPEEADSLGGWSTMSDGIYGLNYRSQTFTPKEGYGLHSLRLRLKKVGNPGQFWIGIFKADANHFPSGPRLAECQFPGGELTPNIYGEFKSCPLDVPLIVEKGVEYCIQCWLMAGDVNNCVRWVHNWPPVIDGYYASESVDGGSSWSLVSGASYSFINYGITPVGGTKFCLRMSADLFDSPPSSGVTTRVNFVSQQGAIATRPLLRLYLK